MPSHLRILSRLYNTPLAISQAKFDVISSNVGMKLLVGDSVPSGEPTPHSKVDISAKSDTAVINVHDSLVSKNGIGDSGVTSYAGVQDNIRSALDAGKKSIVLNIDSPGGEVSGLFSLTDYIHSLSKEGVSTSAFIDGGGTSAAYAIASATQKIYTTPTSVVGSIAAIMDIVDKTQLNEDLGIKHFVIRSKSEKALGNPNEEITPEIVSKYQDQLAKIDTIFNEKVNLYRPNLSIENIINMKGNDFLAEEAKTLGLVDSIVTSIDDVIKPLARPSTTTILTTAKGKTMTLEEALAKNLELTSQLAEMKAERDLAATQAASEEQTRILGILKAADTLHLDSEVAVKRIKAGTSVDDSISLFEDIAEAVQKAGAVDTDTGVSATINKDTVEPEAPSFMASMTAAMETIDTQDKTVTWGGIK